MYSERHWGTISYGKPLKFRQQRLTFAMWCLKVSALHLNYHSLCGFQSLPKPYKHTWNVLSESHLTPQREVQSLQSVTTLIFIRKHNSHEQDGEKKGFSLQKNHSALLLFGWRKEKAALHFPLTSFHRGIKRFALSHLKKRNGTGRAREGWRMAQC